MASVLIPIDSIWFPRRLARGARGSGCDWNSTLERGAGGDVIPVSTWERPLGSWSIESIPFDNKVDADDLADALLTVKHMMWTMGQRRGFIFQPYGDCSFLDGTKITSGGLFKRYDNGAGQTFDRPVIQDPNDTNKFGVPCIFGEGSLDWDIDEGNILTIAGLRIIEVPNYEVIE